MRKERSRSVKCPRFNWIFLYLPELVDILFLDKSDHTPGKMASLMHLSLKIPTIPLPGYSEA